MPYNFYIDNKKEENIIKPYSQSHYDSELHTKDSTISEPDSSGEIKTDSENETTSKENILDTIENKENHNPNIQTQNQKSMDETNGTQSGEFFGNQTPQGTQTLSNSQTDNSYSNQQQNQALGDGIDNLNQNHQTEQGQIENENLSATLIETDDFPPFKNDVWEMFQLQIKDKDSFFKQKDYPRKPLMVDADLYSTLREIDIDNIAPTNLLNAILRTFIESFKEELRQFRKIQAPSVF